MYELSERRYSRFYASLCSLRWRDFRRKAPSAAKITRFSAHFFESLDSRDFALAAQHRPFLNSFVEQVLSSLCGRF